MAASGLFNVTKGLYCRIYSLSCFLRSTVGFDSRSFSTSGTLLGKRNFRKFLLYEKRGTKQFKATQRKNPHPDIPVHTRGVRPIGYTDPVTQKFVVVPEMIPDIIVPDLEGFQLKPYVAYSAPEVKQSEFVAKDLFDAVYKRKMCEDFKEGKLDEEGNPLQPSEEEKLTAEGAMLQARKTGTDMFG